MSLINNICKENTDEVIHNEDNKVVLFFKNIGRNYIISDYYNFLKQNLVVESTLLSNTNGEYLKKKFLQNIKCEYQFKLINLKMKEMLIIRKLTKFKQIIKNNNYQIYLIQRIKTLSKSFDPFIFTTQLSKKYKITGGEIEVERDITIVRALRNLQYQLHKLNNLSF